MVVRLSCPGNVNQLSFFFPEKSNERKSIAWDDEIPTPIMTRLSITLLFLIKKRGESFGIINKLLIALMQRRLVPINYTWLITSWDKLPVYSVCVCVSCAYISWDFCLFFAQLTTFSLLFAHLIVVLSDMGSLLLSCIDTTLPPTSLSSKSERGQKRKDVLFEFDAFK